MITQGRPRLRGWTTLVPGANGSGSAMTPSWGHAVDNSVHRAIVVVDIADSTDPLRRNRDRVIIRQAMYKALTGAFRWRDWMKCYYEDRGDGVLLVVHPRVPKGWLVTVLPEKLGEALAGHNATVAQQEPIRAAATQVRLRIAVHAGEVTFDRHGVVGAAIDYTFRMADAAPLKDAFAKSPDVCGLIVSDWFYSDVVYHHADARPDGYQHVKCQVKQTPVSAWMRTPMPILTRTEPMLTEPILARPEPTLSLRETA